MDKLVYRNELTLGKLTLVLGILVWLLLVVGTFGVVLFYLMLGFVAYLFAQSALISHIKGNAVRLSTHQFPDLYERYLECCRKLKMHEPPAVYVMNGGGVLNAFATRFLERDFVVLLSDAVDALDNQPDGINFYMGHELGHIRMNHLTGHIWRAPVLWLPLVGAAYARAKEYTCDLHGSACCELPQSAPQALLALAAGARRWETANLENFAEQSRLTTDFWGSFHELCNGYPWLTKRVRHVMDPERAKPPRAGFAYVVAFFVPYGGRAGGGALGVLVVAAVIGILAAIALPAYQDYTSRAKVAQAWTEGAAIRTAVGNYYTAKVDIPASLALAGAANKLVSGSAVALNTDTMELDVDLGSGTLQMTPNVGDNNVVGWHCGAGEGLKAKFLPKDCQDPQAE